jgi:hypothetical protein
MKRGVPRDFFFKYYTKSETPKDLLLRRTADYLKRLLPVSSELLSQKLLKIYDYFRLDEEVWHIIVVYCLLDLFNCFSSFYEVYEKSGC